MPCVIYTPEYGVFLGHSMGLAFWSELDPAGQESAYVFDSAQDAIEFLKVNPGLISDPNAMRGVEFVEVTPDVTPENGGRYASPQACMEAGLPGWLTDLTADLHERIYGDRPSMH